MRVWVKVDLCGHFLWKVIASVFPECITQLDIVSAWEMFPLSSIIKTKGM